MESPREQVIETPAFRLIRPAEVTTSVVFSSPHSGRDYPQEFLAASVLSPLQLRSSEDAYVDRLFARAPLMGAPLFLARAPRAFIDLNRGADELDPAVIEGVARPAHNPRISSGLGVIPRVVAGGRAIYSGKMPLPQARERLLQHWHPWHEGLRALLAETQRNFGEAILLDCHSMPHEAIESHARPGQNLPEVVLGDRFGAAADRELVDRIEAIFQAEGFRTARNSPFAGAYIAQTYGHPVSRKHVVQIEIDRSLYLDERRVEPLPVFSAFCLRMARVTEKLAGLGRAKLSLAAE
ncbi:N-formylglutamate amidohydrolase [Rhodobacter sp. KR11]|uniref:N-formylglutamate amidohydrolase n=1 Tax=Rhodobacter sp. KR11 TaxID=2974588 RepID=UPI002222BAB4|nr:N-formylglutamate amidohydrolase [Rhodobacter sp. KR11]MCW1918226.1 N-formylglutamate amidohydrolase [Rhodobacter sp. KR11]